MRADTEAEELPGDDMALRTIETTEDDQRAVRRAIAFGMSRTYPSMEPVPIVVLREQPLSYSASIDPQ